MCMTFSLLVIMNILLGLGRKCLGCIMLYGGCYGQCCHWNQVACMLSDDVLSTSKSLAYYKVILHPMNGNFTLIIYQRNNKMSNNQMSLA